jgi:hypothetical protein
MELSWSRWFRCESSFGLLLVPDLPGIFALAEEVGQAAGPASRRMLAVFEVNEAEYLVQALSQQFASGSRWHERLKTSNCYLRYSIVADADKRHAAAGALRNWLIAQRDTAVCEQPLSARTGEVWSERRAVRAGNGSEPMEPWRALEKNTAQEAATVAERAVDRVMAARPLVPVLF